MLGIYHSMLFCFVLLQVRRGADRAEIYSLAFSNNLQYLAVSSDKGTIHVFNLKINVGLTTNDKPLPAPDAPLYKDRKVVRCNTLDLVRASRTGLDKSGPSNAHGRV